MPNSNGGIAVTSNSQVLKWLRISVAVALLFFIFSKIVPGDVLDAIYGVSPILLLVAGIAELVVHLVGSYRLKRLLNAQLIRISTLMVFEVSLATRFYGLFLPGGNVTALLIRVYKFTSQLADLGPVVTCLFADRVVATLMLCLSGFLCWWWVDPRPESIWVIVFAAAVSGGSIALYLLFIGLPISIPPQLIRKLQSLTPTTMQKQATKLLDKFRGAPKMGFELLLISLALSLMAHIIGIMIYGLVAEALGLSLSWITLVWIRAGMMIVTLLPITIAGLGVRELTAVTLLQQYGVPAEVAIAYSLLIFASTVLGTGLIGGLLEGYRFMTAGQNTKPVG